MTEAEKLQWRALPEKLKRKQRLARQKQAMEDEMVIALVKWHREKNLRGGK